MINKYVDFKVTIWARAHFSDDTDMAAIVEELKNNPSSNAVCDEEKGFESYEILYETEEALTPEDNKGNITIEVYDNNDKKPLWANANPLNLQ